MGQAGAKGAKKGKLAHVGSPHTKQPHTATKSKEEQHLKPTAINTAKPSAPLSPAAAPVAPSPPSSDDHQHPFHAPLDHVREEEQYLYDLVDKTYFSYQLLRKLHRVFTEISSSEVDDGMIDVNEFCDALGLQPSCLLARTIFRIFDTAQSKGITFDAWVTTLSALSEKASLEEKIRFSFNLYDLNGDGSIDLEELRVMLEAAVRENVLNLSEREVKEWCDYTLSCVDRDGNGKVDYDEYRCMVINSQKFLSSFTLDIDELCGSFRFPSPHDKKTPLSQQEMDRRLNWFRSRQKQHSFSSSHHSEAPGSSAADHKQKDGTPPAPSDSQSASHSGSNSNNSNSNSNSHSNPSSASASAHLPPAMSASSKRVIRSPFEHIPEHSPAADEPADADADADADDDADDDDDDDEPLAVTDEADEPLAVTDDAEDGSERAAPTVKKYSSVPTPTHARRVDDDDSKLPASAGADATHPIHALRHSQSLSPPHAPIQGSEAHPFASPSHVASRVPMALLKQCSIVPTMPDEPDDEVVHVKTSELEKTIQ